MLVLKVSPEWTIPMAARAAVIVGASLPTAFYRAQHCQSIGTIWLFYWLCRRLPHYFQKFRPFKKPGGYLSNFRPGLTGGHDGWSIKVQFGLPDKPVDREP